MTQWKCPEWTLKDSFFALLYFTQGLLYGFQVKFLPLYLRRNGFSFTQLGIFRFMTLPWLFKSLWAPLVDGLKSSVLVMSSSLMGIAFMMFMIANWGIKDTVFFSIIILSLNLFTATQDIALGKALMKLYTGDTSSVAKGSSIQVLGYKIGNLFGGGLLMWFSARYNLSKETFAVLSIYHVFLGLFVNQIGSRRFALDSNSCELGKVANGIVKDRTDLESMNGESGFDGLVENDDRLNPLRVFALLKSTFSEIVQNIHLRWIIVFIFTYKLGSQSAHSIYGLLLLDNGMPLWKIGILSGIFGQIVSTFASGFSGALMTTGRLSVMGVQWISCITAITSIMLQFLLSSYQQFDYRIVILSIFLEQVASGMATSAVHSLMLTYSKYASSDTSVTLYTTLSTVENLGKLLSSTFAVFLLNFSNYAVIYFLNMILALLVLPTLYVRPREPTDFNKNVLQV